MTALGQAGRVSLTLSSRMINLLLRGQPGFSRASFPSRPRISTYILIGRRCPTSRGWRNGNYGLEQYEVDVKTE